MTFNFPVLYLGISIVISLLIGIYAWRHPQARGSKAFALACLTFVVWTLGDVLVRISDGFAARWTGEALRFFGVCFLPVVLLAFIRRYCGKPLKRRQIVALCVVPLVSWIMMLTNQWHFLFFKSIEFFSGSPPRVAYGGYFWFVHLPYCYLITIAGFTAALLERRRASRHFRTQISILLFALTIPLAVNAAGIFKLFGERGYTSLSFPLFFSIMAFALFRYSFLVGNPIAYETVFKTMRDGVIIFDRNDTVMDINPAAAETLNRKPSKIVGQNFELIFAPRPELIARYGGERDFYDEIEIAIGEKQHFVSVSITPLTGADGEFDGRIFTFRDITSHKRQQFSLETLAFHDPLTRLANRYRFQEEVEKAVIAAKESEETFAIIYFDLNHFKAVNDTLGHEIGDELLKYVAARTASILRKPDIAARLGGDEFAALIHNCDREQVSLVIERISENARRPFKIGEQTLVADLSIGAALYPEDGKSLTELLRRADAEMYAAKRRREIYNPPPEINFSESLNM
jgi:diguanylate cyclase (GGDEF)-like protein/PAS domain S-box-containing protein